MERAGCDYSDAVDARYGSDSDIATWLPDVRFTPKSGHQATIAACPFRATTGLMHRNKVLKKALSQIKANM